MVYHICTSIRSATCKFASFPRLASHAKAQHTATCIVKYIMKGTTFHCSFTIDVYTLCNVMYADENWIVLNIRKGWSPHVNWKILTSGRTEILVWTIKTVRVAITDLCCTDTGTHAAAELIRGTVARPSRGRDGDWKCYNDKTCNHSWNSVMLYTFLQCP